MSTFPELYYLSHSSIVFNFTNSNTFIIIERENCYHRNRKIGLTGHMILQQGLPLINYIISDFVSLNFPQLYAVWLPYSLYSIGFCYSQLSCRTGQDTYMSLTILKKSR